jgi:multiple sugar transport system substrate-binding protein
MRGRLEHLILVIAALVLATVRATPAAELIVNAYTSDPPRKSAFEQLIEDFEAENPGVQVRFNVFDHQDYKAAIYDFLTSDPPDVVTWFAGNRLQEFVDRGLLEDMSELWEKESLKDLMASSLSALTFGGRQYGVPFAYYQWGFYYRTDLFAQVEVDVPRTWEAFLAACAALKSAGITPIAIGTAHLWPAAGWFDYLNLRINGLPFHLDVTDGRVDFGDGRLRRVFEEWRRLIEGGYFLHGHANYTWEEAQPFLYRGDAAMYLMGNFMVASFPEEIADRMGFFQFPLIDPQLPVYEDAPIDTLQIPVHARNKADARRFLAFTARADNQGKLNHSIGTLPPNSRAAIPDDRFLKVGFEMLAQAAGLAQFFDRDTRPALAGVVMQGFQDFMLDPDRLDQILADLEVARQRGKPHL